jgi:deoxyribonuclease-4
MIKFLNPGLPRVRGDFSKIAQFLLSHNIDGIELEFVRGVYLSEENAKLYAQFPLTYTIHAPYYINLNAKDEKKIERSMEFIEDSCLIGSILGAKIVVVHTAYRMGDSKEVLMKNLEKNLSLLEDRIDGLCVVGLETMGKKSQFGTYEEIVDLLKKMGSKNLSIVLDLAHIYAYSLGELNSYEDFSHIIKYVWRSFCKIFELSHRSNSKTKNQYKIHSCLESLL